MIKQFTLVFLLFLVLTSCSEYQKAVKSKDNDTKFKVGTQYYEKGKYAKTILLFESMGGAYRSHPDGEKMYYMFGDSYYKKKQYLLAAYQYETFVASFPKSEKLEECAYLSAKCYTFLSAKYSLDQKQTIKAIDKLQNFINDYPKSVHLEEANRVMKELTTKLEKKAFEIAKQYNTTSNHKAAIKALDIFMSENPGSVFREESLFLKLDSGYKLAINSIEEKKLERLNNAKGYYNSLVKFNKETTYKEQADKMLAEIEIEIKQFNK